MPDPFFDHLGIRIVEGPEDQGRDGQVVVEMEMRDDLRGPYGLLQGGIVATLIDVAGAACAARAVGPGRGVATSDMTIRFLAPGRVGPIRATGTPLRAGKNAAVAEIRVTDAGQDDRLLAVGHLAVSVLSGSPPG